MAKGANVRALHNLRLIVNALALVILAGTAGFHFIEGWSWFDGFYMVITTLTTIGYQETHPLSHAGRVFNVCVIVAGVSLVFLAIGALTQALLEFERRSFFGRRKMEREIDRLTDTTSFVAPDASGAAPLVSWRAGRHRSSLSKQRSQSGTI
jgi:voltage-gated potassium channel